MGATLVEPRVVVDSRPGRPIPHHTPNGCEIHIGASNSKTGTWAGSARTPQTNWVESSDGTWVRTPTRLPSPRSEWGASTTRMDGKPLQAPQIKIDDQGLSAPPPKQNTPRQSNDSGVVSQYLVV